MRILIVTNPFGGHETGHRITDAEEIEAVLAGEHARDVVAADHDLPTADKRAVQKRGRLAHADHPTRLHQHQRGQVPDIYVQIVSPQPAAQRRAHRHPGDRRHGILGLDQQPAICSARRTAPSSSARCRPQVRWALLYTASLRGRPASAACASPTAPTPPPRARSAPARA
ncbi:MAG: hypothetical protein U0835_00165 [Isosphaeraceae bacterium]